MDTRTAGRKGGLVTKKRGPAYYKKIQRLSTESKLKKKQVLLSKFTVEDVLNPITSQSIGEKIDQIETGPVV